MIEPWPLNDLSGPSMVCVLRCSISSHQELKAPAAESSHHIKSSYSWADLRLSRARACAPTGIISALPAVVSTICRIALGLKWQVDLVCGDFAIIKLSERHRDLSRSKKNKSGRQRAEEVLKQISALSLFGGKLWNCYREKKAGNKCVLVKSHLQPPIIAPSGSSCCLLPNITVLFYFQWQF